MQISTLFPRPLNPEQGSEESALVLGAMFVRAYFDRGQARMLGWRGVLPRNQEKPAWTCRVAGSDVTFGILFEEETVNDHFHGSINGEDGLKSQVLWGRFSLFTFPSPDASLLDTFPLVAMAAALDDNYPECVRNFASDPAGNAAFHTGVLHLGLKLDGSGLVLLLEAKARKQVYALDGVTGADPGTGVIVQLVEPGGLESDIPAFRVCLPLLTALSASFRFVLSEEPTLAAGSEPSIQESFDRFGRYQPLPDKKGRTIRLALGFGEAPFPRDLKKRSGNLPHIFHIQHNNIALSRPLLHILTGFLGAGKTSFLREWLNFLHSKNRYTGVIQNEFGQVGLDTLLLHGEAIAEQLDDGCVCCSLADSLRPGIMRITQTLSVRQIILETSGVANPANILDALRALDDMVVPGLVICILDAKALLCSLDPERGILLLAGVLQEQILVAQVLVLNKIDLVSAADIGQITKALHSLNAGVRVLHAQRGHILFAELDAIHHAMHTSIPDSDHNGDSGSNTCSYEQIREYSALSNAAHRDEGYAAYLLNLPDPISVEELDAILARLQPGACRIKGIVSLHGQGKTIVQYASGLTQLEPCFMPAETGWLVAIGKELPDPASLGVILQQRIKR